MEEFEYPKNTRDVGSHIIIQRHYYGTLVRELFLVAGVCMLIGLPFFSGSFHIPVFLSMIAVVLFTSLAGLTSRKQRFVVGLDIGASLIGLLVFEFGAVRVFASYGANAFFWFTQIIAILFFFIFYFSVKTFRALVIEHTISPEEGVDIKE